MTGTTLPGSKGLPIVGETPSFLRDVHAFVDSRITYYGRVFRTNLLSFPTIISCSHRISFQALSSDSQPNLKASTAYSEFLGQIYPKPNFLTADDHSQARAKASRFLFALQQPTISKYQNTIDSIIDKHLNQLRSHVEDSPTASSSIQPYAFFKNVCEEIITIMVMGPLSDGLYRKVRKLCSDHFNGVVAIPMRVTVFGVSTARQKGIQGYHELEDILSKLVQLRCVQEGNTNGCIMDVIISNARENGDKLDDLWQDHLVRFLLVLLSTAIPKCLASALSSVLRQASKDTDTSELLRGETMHYVMMEVLRLWPPMMGGMRMTSGEEVRIDGHKVKGLWRVWYSIWHSNRDEEVYNNGEHFDPNRWRGLQRNPCPFASAQRKELPILPLTFGAGRRKCAGSEVAWMILMNVTERFAREFSVDKDEQNRVLRFFPVLRERDDLSLTITLRNEMQKT